MCALAGDDSIPDKEQGSLPGESHSWRTLLAGSALFLTWGLVAILSEIAFSTNGAWFATYISASRLFEWLVFLVPPIVVGYAWIHNFPRWTYPYVGSALLYTYFVAANMIATPQIALSGNAPDAYIVWGWRAWIPLILAIGIAIAITRSMHPLIRFFTNAWIDWTLLSFAMFGWAPLFLLAVFDEVATGYTLIFLPPLEVMVVATALIYLASRRMHQRIWSLFAGASLSLALMLVVTEIYWSGVAAFNAARILLILAVFLGVMFSPALIGVFRHFQQRGALQAP